MKEKIVFLFPGQGAQYKGMGQDLYKNFAAARYVFEYVSDLAHCDMKKLCFETANAELRQPDKASLTTLTHSVSIANIIKSQLGCELHEVGNSIVGHSMGQYSALCCAGSLSLQDTVDVLKARSSYTIQVGENGAGMICISGLQEWKIQEMIESVKNKGFAAVANRNLRDQFVISGENDALKDLLVLAKDAGAALVKRLAVTVPAHCILMKHAGELLEQRLQSISIKAPNMNWFSNETANVMSNPNDIKEALVKQMSHGVNWVGIMERFPEYNITHSYELGPGKVLSGLVRRANIGCSGRYTDSLENVKLVCQELENLMMKNR